MWDRRVGGDGGGGGGWRRLHPLAVDKGESESVRGSVACRHLHRHSAAPRVVAAMGDEEQANDLDSLKRSMQYALIKNCDMNEEMRSDCVDAVISAAEKCAAVF